MCSRAADDDGWIQLLMSRNGPITLGGKPEHKQMYRESVLTTFDSSALKVLKVFSARAATADWLAPARRIAHASNPVAFAACSLRLDWLGFCLLMDIIIRTYYPYSNEVLVNSNRGATICREIREYMLSWFHLSSNLTNQPDPLVYERVNK